MLKIIIIIKKYIIIQLIFSSFQYPGQDPGTDC